MIPLNSAVFAHVGSFVLIIILFHNSESNSICLLDRIEYPN